MNTNNIIRSVLAAELVLLLPLIAMMFSDQVNWSVADFIIVGILLAGAGFAYQLIINGVKTGSRQTAIGIAIAALIVLIWAELAVGVFGSPIAGT